MKTVSPQENLITTGIKNINCLPIVFLALSGAMIKEFNVKAKSNPNLNVIYLTNSGDSGGF